MSRALLVPFAILASACSSGAHVRVAVSNIPGGAAALVVSVAVDGLDAPPQRIASPAPGEQSVAVAVPSTDLSWSTIDLSVVDGAGCEIAGQVLSGRVIFDAGLAEVGTALVTRSAGLCAGDHHAGMLVVPAGSYLIGCDVASDPACTSDAGPQVAVDVPSFEIDRYEVTLGAYTACVNHGACPASSVAAVGSNGIGAQNGTTWPAANSYCRWHSRRLPTEAEWEAAARGTDGRLYPWGAAAPTCALANYYPKGAADGCRAADQNALLVGACPLGASPLGMEDAAGNVLEWVQDFAGRRDALRSNEDRLAGPASGDGRILKGGGAAFTETALRTTWRASLNEDGSGDPMASATENLTHIGFRCARSR